MNIPTNLKFTKSHEWVKEVEAGVEIGLTDYAQHTLGDLVFVNLPQEGDPLTAGEAFGDVESVKAVSDVYSPVTGTVLAVNQDLLDAPESINTTPYDSWLIRAGEVSHTEPLMNGEEYAAFLKTEAAH